MLTQVHVLGKNTSVGQGIVLAAFAMVLYTPLAYFTDRAVYKAGQTMTLTALGGGAEPVFVDLIKDGQTLLTETVEVSGGSGTLSVDLPADLFGTVQLVAYRLNATGLPVRKKRVLYVKPADGVKIRATP